MRQFDVFAHHRPSERHARPFVLVLQHDRLSQLVTVVIAPVARAAPLRAATRMCPAIRIQGREFFLLTQEVFFIPKSRLAGPPIDNLLADQPKIIAALDHVFSAAG